jgi:hypothetical protein
LHHKYLITLIAEAEAQVYDIGSDSEYSDIEDLSSNPDDDGTTSQSSSSSSSSSEDEPIPTMLCSDFAWRYKVPGKKRIGCSAVL